jgi:hypothetical protein
MSRRIRWAGHVAHMGRKLYTEFWLGNFGERDHLEDVGVDGRIIFIWIFKQWVGEHGLDRSGSGEGQTEGTCECGKEPSGSIKCGEFLD